MARKKNSSRSSKASNKSKSKSFNHDKALSPLEAVEALASIARSRFPSSAKRSDAIRRQLKKDAGK